MSILSKLPDQKGLNQIAAVFEKHGITWCLGGSSLLVIHGLENVAHDWDIMTNAPREKIEPLLSKFSYKILKAEGVFKTNFPVRISFNDCHIDLMDGFCIQTPHGIYELPLIQEGSWNSIPLSSLEVWYVAYTLMDRTDKAQKILNYLIQNGANKDSVKRLLHASLPEQLKKSLELFL